MVGFEIETMHFDLSLESHGRTGNQVASDAAQALRAARLGIKAATIAPEGTGAVGSPNAILRPLGTVSDGIRTSDLGRHAATGELGSELLRRVVTKIDVWSALGVPVPRARGGAPQPISSRRKASAYSKPAFSPACRARSRTHFSNSNGSWPGFMTWLWWARIASIFFSMVEVAST